VEKFLTYATKEILASYSIKDLHLLTVIVPSERSKWHLRNCFKDAIGEVVLFPEFKTIQNYFNSISKLSTISSLEASLMLYEQALKLDKDLNYNEFQNQSSTLLKNFNEVERNMIDHQKLFQELDNITGIDDWSLNDKNLSKNQNNFVSLFKKIGELYKIFKKRLIEKKKGTGGLITRTIAENPKDYFPSNKKICFLGLNALSKSEETIVNYLTKNNSSKIIVDVDEFYTMNEVHEAGFFYRKHFTKHYNKPSKKILNHPKKINIYSSFSSNQQINIAENIVKNSTKNFTFILMDENLGPLLYQKLLKNEKSINYSSGLKIKYFESNKLIRFLLETNPIFGKNKISFQWMEELVNFSEIGNTVSKKEIKNLFIEKQKHAFEINSLKLKKHHPNLDLIITCLEELQSSLPSEVPKKITQLINIVEKIYNKSKNDILSLDKIKETILKITDELKNYKIELNSSQFLKLFLKEINGLSVVIKGENDARIQIIGLLESRTLDYENVVFISCNEEFLPSKANSIDLFPEDLKKFFGIPSIYEREALSAYYFFRNFHYSKNINLLFVKGDDKGLTYNEPSRYIRQIEKELGEKENFKIKHHHIKMDITQKVHEVNNSKKTKEILIKWMQEGISPSSVQKYCTCPLDFYFKYVLKIKEKKKINQHLEPSEWGIGIHKTLEVLFYKGRKINIHEIKKIKTELNQRMEDTFDQIFVDKRFINGKNALIYHHFKKCIENLLDKEILEINSFGEYKILETENELISYHPYTNEKSINKIKFLGHVDRIDSTDQGIRLIDYKTGMVLQKDLNIYDYNQLTKKHKALQLFFYALLWNNSQEKTDNLTCQIISLKNTYQPKLNLTFKKNDTINNELVSNYSNWLINFVEEIKNTEVFNHRIDSSYCEIC
tara:strand:- start:885 stop:3569 length:2685 start_codon:yes stop_codon:yes gene_type:complete